MDDIIRQAIHDFRAYLQRRHYAAHTLANYTLDLQLFFATCPQPLAQVSFRDIERFIDQQYHQGLAPTTLHRRLHALKHFFDYLLEREGEGRLRQRRGRGVSVPYSIWRGLDVIVWPGLQEVRHHGGGLRWQQLVHALVNARSQSMLAPALRGFPMHEILTLAGRAHEQVGLQRIAGGAHQNRPIGLGHDIVQEHQLDGGGYSAIDLLRQLGPGLLGHQGDGLTKRLACGEGAH